MFKPLLRSIPNLTGNFTLACKLDKYRKNSIINYSSGVTEAVLMPLQNNLANKHVNVSLLYDSYEYDVQIYYKSFSSMFYEDNYYFDQNNVYDLDLSSNKTYESRNKDYEFGCKRNIMNSGYQYMFYAPFYVTNTKSLPDEFVIHIDFDDNIYKNIHVKIFDNNDTDNISNYLSVYLKRYVEKIDERCIFCLPESNQAAYFGIDVQTGGFKNCKDNVIGIIYNKQLSLNEFDKIINEGFSRNKIIMKQVIPLSFMFNIEDILTKNEYETYLNRNIKISGWYERNEMKYDFYDFDTDYKELILNNVNILNPELLKNKTKTGPNNNKNLKYSLHEAIDLNYKYDNTLSKTYNRWCLLPTLNNEEQYITNSSQVFLDTHDNYYNVPILYQSNSSYLYYDNEKNDIDINKSFNDLIYNNIDNIITETHHKEENILSELQWYDVYNNKCIIGGILYDLNNLAYTQTVDSKGITHSKYTHIDKFNIFAYVNIIDVNGKHMKYCKHSFNTDNPLTLTATAYNGYKENMFRRNVAQYGYMYEKYHEMNTLFSYDEVSYDTIASCYSNPSFFNDNEGVKNFSYTDELYVDYSYHYYPSNMYMKVNDIYESEMFLNSNLNFYSGFEIYDEVDVPTFVDAISTYSYIYEPEKTVASKYFGKKLTDICYVVVNQSSNVREISDNSIAGNINNRNSKIAFFNSFVNCHDLIYMTYLKEYETYLIDDNVTRYRTPYEITMEDYMPNINSYYHYVPDYENSAFVSHGHMEKNNVHTDYVYCDYWILTEYIKYINKFVTPKITKNEIDNMYINTAYMGFMNYDHYKKYKDRMYKKNSNKVQTYVLKVNPALSLIGNNISKFKLLKSYVTLERYIEEQGINQNNEEEMKSLICELIDDNRLYHYDKVVIINQSFRDKILEIYKNNDMAKHDKSLSLILYTTNTDIIDNFKIDVNNTRVNDKFATSNEELLLIPITAEILWSDKSIDETYTILSSDNIKNDTKTSYITHAIYDLESCNKINTNDYNDLYNVLQLYEEDTNFKLYKRINIPTIENDGQLHIVNNNGENYAYYYITFNLYNNIYSFNINTDNNVDTFDPSKLSLKKLLPFFNINVLDYIVNTLGKPSIINKNDLIILIDKIFDETSSTVVKRDVETKLNISRYYNDITPRLINASHVTTYDLIYNIPDNVRHKNVYYNNVAYSSGKKSIDVNSSEDMLYPGIAYVNYDGGVNNIYEYEQKFYNNNTLYLLSKQFEIYDSKLYTLDEVRTIEEDEYVFKKVFIPHMKIFKSSSKLDEDEYLFLFNRYKVDYMSYPVRLNLLETEKMYKLKFTFTLI